MTQPPANPLDSDQAPAGSPLYSSSAPLGGSEPIEPEPQRESKKHLILALLLLIISVLTGKASTMPWRDYLWHNTATVVETGWTRHDGVLGLGWVTMVFAICLAGSGLLIATARERVGRILAVTTGIALMLLATMEWGVSGAGSRNGPGSGLWLQLLAGAAAVLVVGMISPAEEDD